MTDPWEDRDRWHGALRALGRGRATQSVVMPIRKSQSGSEAFLALASDGHKYWVKVPGNPQGDLVLVTEKLVGEIGRLISAPVRPTALLRIPDELRGWKYGQYGHLNAGTAHGSLHLDSAEESDELIYARRDDNQERMAALLGLWDLCMGGDPQWLYAQAGDYSVWSFDHGFWLGGEPDWDTQVLEHIVARDWSWRDKAPQVSIDALRRTADRIDALTPTELLEVIARVPAEWVASDWAIESVGWLVYSRRHDVAARLRSFNRTLGTNEGR